MPALLYTRLLVPDFLFLGLDVIPFVEHICRREAIKYRGRKREVNRKKPGVYNVKLADRMLEMSRLLSR